MEQWYLLKIIWVSLALAFLWAALILIWRFRDIFGWKKSLRAELASLKSSADQNGLPVKDGLDIILDTCGRTLKSFSPDFSELNDLPAFIRSIAACFHPHSDSPELQISIRSILQTTEKSLDQFSFILQRPGFSRLESINLHTIMETRRWYLQVSGSVIYQWFSKYKQIIQRVSYLRLVLFLDPLIFLVYLSRRLTQLVCVKYLMVDLYIFIGKLALEAYNETDLFPLPESEKEIEETLTALDALADLVEPDKDPLIQEVRDRLVGFSSMLASNPTFKQWQHAIFDAAEIISKKHFPDSDHPLEEAAIGPLLESARQWATRLRKGTEYLWLRRLYHVRLETIIRAKDLSYHVFPKPVQTIIKTGYKTYGTVKWPLKVYRMIRRFTPWKLSLEVGWMVSKKAGIALLYGRTFDMACDECERIYRSSRELGVP